MGLKSLVSHSKRFLLLTLTLVPFMAFAGSGSDVDAFIAAYQTATEAWEPIIHNLTLSLFWGLVTISFTWSSIQIALKDGGLVDVVADLVGRVMTVGVCVFLLNHAADLARVLISSFQTIGTRLSGGTVAFSPGNVIELGLNIVGGAWEKISLMSPVMSLMLCLSTIVILICFALIALEMTVLIVTSFVTVSGGVAMMGFLGSEWTREHAMNYFTAVLGIAVKMFVMQLILSLGYGFIHDMTAAIDANNKSNTNQYMTLLVMTVVFYGLMKEIPGMAASLASGRFVIGGGSAAVNSAINTVTAMAVGAVITKEHDDNDDKHRGMNTGPANPGSPYSTGGESDGGQKPSRNKSNSE
jgi:type IV secretion system protein TrbL